MPKNQDICLCGNSISNCLLENNLLLNKNKTELLNIYLSGVKFPVVTLGDIIIKQSLKVKSLGFIINKKHFFHLYHKSQIYVKPLIYHIKLKPYVNVFIIMHVSYWSTHSCSRVLTTQTRYIVTFQTIDSTN